jgi:hypothetical protein
MLKANETGIPPVSTERDREEWHETLAVVDMHVQIQQAYAKIVEAFATGTTRGSLRGTLINWHYQQVDVLSELGS